MTNAELLDQLQDLTHRLGIEVRMRSGEFTGGICRVQGQKILFINAALSTEKRIEVFCRELSRLDLSGVFVLPALRDRLEPVHFQA